MKQYIVHLIQRHEHHIPVYADNEEQAKQVAQSVYEGQTTIGNSRKWCKDSDVEYVAFLSHDLPHDRNPTN